MGLKSPPVFQIFRLEWYNREMTQNPVLTPEQEAKKEAWLKDLANFIVEANTHTWAAEGAEVKVPQRPGYKELRWPIPNSETGRTEGDWELRDSYTGYFRAPGMTTVYYKGEPAWTMAYSGRGMVTGKYSETKQTFTFLKEALMKVTPDLPYRGPRRFENGGWVYEMEIHGNIEDFSGDEDIQKDYELMFSQVFSGGIVINEDHDKNPVFPWER